MPFSAMSNTIKYRSEYKYQLAENYSIKIPIYPDDWTSTEFIQLEVDGWLTIWKGYAWDGPSGPVMDTKETMRASLVHDALYQLMRWGVLDGDVHQEAADKIFKRICIEDGLSKSLAKIFYKGLLKFGKPNRKPINKKKTHRAPKNR